MSTASETSEVSEALLERVLSPYMPHCRFLKRADVTVTHEPGKAHPTVIARGDFEIENTWYIDDTGHFNAIDFNLCFNMLGYTGVAQAAIMGSVPTLSHLTPEVFFEAQLPNMFIARFASRFPKAMRSDRFKGEIMVRRLSKRKGRSDWMAGRTMVLAQPSVRFYDDAGGEAEGSASIVLVDGPGAAAYASDNTASAAI